MTEPMSEEQLAEIRAAADRDRWSTYCGHAGPRAMVTDLLAEVERLRAQLAEIGDEWQVRYKLHPNSLTEWTEPTRREQVARNWIGTVTRHTPTCEATLLHRKRSDWHDVEQDVTE